MCCSNQCVLESLIVFKALPPAWYTGYKWTVALLQLVAYATLLLPGFIQVHLCQCARAFTGASELRPIR